MEQFAKQDITDARVKSAGPLGTLSKWSLIATTAAGIAAAAYAGAGILKARESAIKPSEQPVQAAAEALPQPLEAVVAPTSAGGPEAGPQLTDLYVEVQSSNDGIKSIIAGQARQDERLARIEQSVATLQETLEKQATAARTVSRPKPAIREATQVRPAKAEVGVKLLAVDMWGGKASAVVGTGQDSDRRMAFLAEGDQQSGVTIKKIDPVTGSAVLSHAGKDYRLSRED